MSPELLDGLRRDRRREARRACEASAHVVEHERATRSAGHLKPSACSGTVGGLGRRRKLEADADSPTRPLAARVNSPSGAAHLRVRTAVATRRRSEGAAPCCVAEDQRDAVPLQARTTRRASAQVVALTLTYTALSGPFGLRRQPR